MAEPDDCSNEGGRPKRSIVMKLANLANLLGAQLQEHTRDDVPITGVQDDSRRVGSGDLFVAVRGLSVDGHNFVDVAERQGAAALVVEHPVESALPQIIVDSASDALGVLAAHAAGRPADSLETIGITGTNGKTTTSYLIEAILQAAGRSPGVVGTVSYRWNGQERAAPYTTPTPLVLQEAFTKMAQEGCDSALLEVSSAALHMKRLVGTLFDVTAFSNLSQDHLDVHKTMLEYREAKASLFRSHMAHRGTAVINIDDDHGSFMAQAAQGSTILRVSRRAHSCNAEIRVLRFSSSIDGITAEIATPRGNLTIRSRALIGDYNVDNIALAVGVGEALGLPHEAITRGIAEMGGVPGRVERVKSSEGLNIFVDYAHTPDALQNVLAALRPLTRGRLLCVFGCGGDRDVAKRPLMGAAVAEAADLCFVTSDNPRTEDPQGILEQIISAVPEAFFVDTDRRLAIVAAIAEACPLDVVLIAGKGHEDYQIIGHQKTHFDDREEARTACQLRHKFLLSEILSSTGGVCRCKGTAKSFSRVLIDGRQAAPGDLYIAISGEVFDGHEFCQQAIDAGATGILVSAGRSGEFTNTTVIEVENPREALGQIASRYRETMPAKVIGITGSAGKTTTKELLAAALRSSGQVHAAVGSNNNETGVPLTVLGIRGYHDYAIIEMGMRGPGEISYLCNIAKPDIAVVTNAGSAHVGRLGGPGAISLAKGEIYQRDEGRNKIGIFPKSDSRLQMLARTCTQRLSFEDCTRNDEAPAKRGVLQLLEYQAHGSQGANLKMQYEEKQVRVKLPLLGKHNAINACCALLAATAAGAKLEEAAESIATVAAPPMRGEVRSIAGRELLLDCYNANPASMEAALETLSDLRGSQKAIAVLGDMLELGERAAREHERLGAFAAALGISIIALGSFCDHIATGAHNAGGCAQVASSPLQAAQAALAGTNTGDWILLKASRGMKLERVAESMQTEAAALADK